MSWSSSHRGAEYRLIMAAVTGLCALAVVASVVPVVEHIAGVVLIAGAVLAVVAAVVRRELRIRRRIADTDGTWHAFRPSVVRRVDDEHAVPPAGGAA